MAKTTRIFDPRQTMHRSDFEIFHYHDAKMQEVPLHHHDFYEVYFFLEGAVEYQVEGRGYTLRPMDFLLISPRELHRPKVAPEREYERIVLWINATYLRQIAAGAPVLSECFETGQNLFPGARSAAALLIHRLAEASASGTAEGNLRSRGLFFQFLAELLRLVKEQRTDAQGARTTPLIEEVLRYLGEHYREELSLDAVAERFYVSKYYLSHLFSSSVGTSLYRYVLLKRLQRAKELLAEGSNPGDACRSCGFQDYTSFYRSFRAVYGVSPQEAAKADQRIIQERSGPAPG